jgi:hypothetical protein
MIRSDAVSSVVSIPFVGSMRSSERPSVTTAPLPNIATERVRAGSSGMWRTNSPLVSNCNTPSSTGTHTAPPTAAIGPTGSEFGGSCTDVGSPVAGMRFRNASGTVAPGDTRGFCVRAQRAPSPSAMERMRALKSLMSTTWLPSMRTTWDSTAPSSPAS